MEMSLHRSVGPAAAILSHRLTNYADRPLQQMCGQCPVLPEFATRSAAREQGQAENPAGVSHGMRCGHHRSLREDDMKLTTEDYVEIQQLYARYSFAIDGLDDLDSWLDCFTADAEHRHFMDAPNFTVGRKALRAKAEQVMASRKNGLYHWTNSLVIEPTEYGASGKCYFLGIWDGREAGPVEMSTLDAQIGPAYVYRDELVKDNGRWRFRRRTLGPQGWNPDADRYLDSASTTLADFGEGFQKGCVRSADMVDPAAWRSGQ